MMKCPFGCSHHTFPNHFNFFYYCGFKLENDPSRRGIYTKKVSKYENLVKNRGTKKASVNHSQNLQLYLKEMENAGFKAIIRN